jgi:hypothetical protein
LIGSRIPAARVAIQFDVDTIDKEIVLAQME